MKISRILCAVDGSTHSIKGVEYAAAIANATGAKLLLYHVIKPYNLPDALKKFAKDEHIKTFDADLLRQGAKYLLAGARDAAHREGVRDPEIDMDEGPIARSIAEKAEIYKADMVVIGSRGMGDLEGMLRGGVSHRVESLAKCPVLVVK